MPVKTRLQMPQSNQSQSAGDLLLQRQITHVMLHVVGSNLPSTHCPTPHSTNRKTR